MIEGMTPGFKLENGIWRGVHYEGWSLYPVKGWWKVWPTRKFDTRWAVGYGDQKVEDIPDDMIFDHLDDAKGFVAYDNWPPETFEIGDHVYYVSRGEPYHCVGRVFEISSYTAPRWRGANKVSRTITIFIGKQKFQKPFTHIHDVALRKGPKVWPLLMLPGKPGF